MHFIGPGGLSGCGEANCDQKGGDEVSGVRHAHSDFGM
jgi:hypothetical protein